MKKEHVIKEHILKVCTYCAWKGMKYSAKWDKSRCDMCGRVGVIFAIRPCNLQ